MDITLKIATALNCSVAQQVKHSGGFFVFVDGEGDLLQCHWNGRGRKTLIVGRETYEYAHGEFLGEHWAFSPSYRMKAARFFFCMGYEMQEIEEGFGFKVAQSDKVKWARQMSEAGFPLETIKQSCKNLSEIRYLRS